MEGRDEKGRFAQGNKSPAQFKRGGKQSEVARQGGIASGVAKREKKKWSEMLREICDQPFTIKLPDGKKSEGTLAEGVLYGQIREAIKGNTKAAKFVATLLGEYVEKSETMLNGMVATTDNVDITKLTDEQRAVLLSIGEQVLNNGEG